MEFLVNALLSIVLTVIVAKLIFLAFNREERESVERSLGKEGEEEIAVVGDRVVVEERRFEGESRNRGLVSEKKVEFVGEAVRIDEFEGGVERVNKGDDFVKDRLESPEVPAIGEKKEVEEDDEVVNAGIGEESVEVEEIGVKEEDGGVEKGGFGEELVAGLVIGVEEGSKEGDNEVGNAGIGEELIEVLEIREEEENEGEEEVEDSGFREELEEFLVGGGKEETKGEDEVGNGGIKEVSMSVSVPLETSVKDECEEVKNGEFKDELVGSSEIGLKEESKEEGEIKKAELGEESMEISTIGLKEKAKEEVEIKTGELVEKSVEEVSCKEKEEVKADVVPEYGVLEENLNKEMPEKEEVHGSAMELKKQEETTEKDGQVEFSEHEVGTGLKKRGEDESLISDDEDWEGIETTEMEKRFGAAAAFVGSGENNDRLSKLSSDVQMQMYGLHKVATEGPCREQPPLALMISSRAKWNSWQRLGNMSPEVAMEQYVNLLSDEIPDWMGGNPEVEQKADKSMDSSEAGKSGTRDHESSFLHHQPGPENESKPELQPLGECSDVIGGSEPL